MERCCDLYSKRGFLYSLIDTLLCFLYSSPEAIYYSCVYIYLSVELGSFIKDANFTVHRQLIPTDVCLPDKKKKKFNLILRH